MSVTMLRVPLTLTPADEGGYVVTCAVLPELITEGDSVEECLENARDALIAVREMYEDSGKPLPDGIVLEYQASTLSVDLVVEA